MSRFLYRNLELLEPYEGKLSCTVLRGESSRKGADLPDQVIRNLRIVIMTLCKLKPLRIEFSGRLYI